MTQKQIAEKTMRLYRQEKSEKEIKTASTREIINYMKAKDYEISVNEAEIILEDSLVKKYDMRIVEEFILDDVRYTVHELKITYGLEEEEVVNVLVYEAWYEGIFYEKVEGVKACPFCGHEEIVADSESWANYYARKTGAETSTKGLKCDNCGTNSGLEVYKLGEGEKALKKLKDKWNKRV